LRVIMLALPVDARARAACVCRSWRAFLADTSLWQVLDLTPSGGVAVRVTENLVRGAVARAAGRLRTCPHNGYRGPACALTCYLAHHADTTLTRYPHRRLQLQWRASTELPRVSG
jgi:hypothetical protein